MFFKYNWATVLWALFLLLITLTPGNAMPSTGNFTVPHLDKVVHFTGFGILAFLMMRGFKKQNSIEWLKKKPVLSSLILAVSFGIIIEIIQLYIPERSFDLLDIFANTAGIFVGLVVYIFSTK
ncbi:hypothetical protein BH23BAC1_BH23BAC1_29260 [soil metagenome]